MHRNSEFSLFRIAGVPYLLPFGQGIARHKRGVRINETGIYLWELLGEDLSEKEILSRFTAHYGNSGAEPSELETDLSLFLQMLNRYDILENDTPNCSVSPGIQNTVSGTDAKTASIENPDFLSDSDTNAASVPPCRPDPQADPYNLNIPCQKRRYLRIGGLTLMFRAPQWAFPPEFNAFEIPAVSHVHQTITVAEQAPLPSPGGKILLQDRELTVWEKDLQYVFFFPTAPGIHEARLTKDGKDAIYYCRPPYTDTFRQDLFHAIRLSFLYLAQLHHMAVLHSASLLYRDRAWLFSGHSGAGKSTHANLWKELYHVPLLNGDLNLLSMENGSPTVHGLPWCGTSGISDTSSHPLGGILLVKKSLENHCVSLSDDKARLLVSQRLISPCWTERLMQKNLDFTDTLAPHILIRRLYCTKTHDAAETAKKAIDDYLL